MCLVLLKVSACKYIFLQLLQNSHDCWINKLLGIYLNYRVGENEVSCHTYYLATKGHCPSNCGMEICKIGIRAHLLLWSKTAAVEVRGLFVFLLSIVNVQLLSIFFLAFTQRVYKKATATLKKCEGEATV